MFKSMEGGAVGTRVVRRFLLSPAEESLVALRFCLVRPPRPVDSSMVWLDGGGCWRVECGWWMVDGGWTNQLLLLVLVADLLLLAFQGRYKMIFSHPFARNLGTISLCLEARS